MPIFSRTKHLVFNFTFFLLFFCFSNSAYAQSTINATADTYINSNNPTTVYATATLLESNRHDSNPQRTAFFHFDFSSLEGNEISQALLKFTSNNQDSSLVDSSNRSKMKSIRLIPYEDQDFSTFTYNDSLFLNENDATLADSSVDVHSYYKYPIVHEFRLNLTGGDTALETAYKAKVDSIGSGNANVEIDLTDAVSQLAGKQFIIVIENQRGNLIRIHSLENTGGFGVPRFEVTTTPATDTSVDTSNLSLNTLNQCSADTYLSNGMSGYYEWRNNETNPNFSPAQDVYERFEWDELETSKGDYSGIETEIEPYLDALSDGQKFGFRIRMMEGNGNALPTYLTGADGLANCDDGSCIQSCVDYTDVPDWNDSYLLARAELLVTELATRYADDPRISWIEIGMFGTWGEASGGCSDTATLATKQTLIDMWYDNFPNTQLLTVTDDQEMLIYAMELPENSTGQLIGLRRDSLGADNLHFSEMSKEFDSWWALKDRWKYAPLMTEYINPIILTNAVGFDIGILEATQWGVSGVGNGNTGENTWANFNAYQQSRFTAAGLAYGPRVILNKWGITANAAENQSATLYTNWLNLGNTPVYEPYTAKIIFKSQSNGSIASTYTLPINFKELLPTNDIVAITSNPKEYTQTVTLPEAGTYDVYLSITDAQIDSSSQPRDPLSICNADQQIDDTYSLGTLTITASNSEISSNNSVSTASFSSGKNENDCMAPTPHTYPELFEVQVEGSSATVFFAPINERVSQYLISYEIPGYPAAEYSDVVPVSYSSGVISHQIHHLQANTPYQFRVRAYNDCAPGQNSNHITITTAGKFAQLQQFFKL